MKNNDILLEVNNLCYKYQKSSTLALNNISFKIKRNSYVTIIGHNGSGKSTLSKLISGLFEPLSGSIFFNNYDLFANHRNLTKNIGIVFQNPDNQFIGSTVLDDIVFGMENHCFSREKIIDNLQRSASLLGIKNLLNKVPSSLSGGEKQKVAIAGIVALDSDLIILDEATSMLDPKGTEDLLNVILKLKNDHNKTIISITHNMDEAYKGDWVIVLNNGEKVLEGIPDDVFRNQELLKTFKLSLPPSLVLQRYLEKHNFTFEKNYKNFDELVLKICQS
ncbi:energy-coupling factor transporter ATPase [symbiont of Argiope bruennichi]|uniref:energy-coupling factor transporter ATPase n=1 Tax=symbiont of Argiope bruennichi TaxID=2810479 RepID=UPI003DA42429